MKPIRQWRWPLTVLLLLSSATGTWAGVTKAEGLEVWIDETWPDSVQAGYTPVRVVVADTAGKKRSLTLVLTTPGEVSVVSRVERSFAVDAGKTAEFTLHIPATQNYSYYMANVLEEGREIADLRQSVNLRTSHSHTQATLLIIADTPEDMCQLIASHIMSGPSGTGSAMMQMTTQQMPQGWIGYTRIGIIGVSAATLEAMPPARRDDLRRWAAAGGTLFVYRPVPGGLPPLRLLLGEMEEYPDILKHYFGHIHVLDDDPFPGTQTSWSELLTSHLNARAATFTARYGFNSISNNAKIRIPGIGKVPARGYAIMVTLFALLIGPVNYFVLKWKRKLHLLFVLTPAIAVAVTVAMAAYGLISEGLGVKGVTYSVTWLDQDRHEAVTLGAMGMYAGMSPSGGLSFPLDAAVFPRGGDMSGGTLEVSDTQRFGGGFARARTVLSYSTAHVAPARGRLRVERIGSQLRVTNGLEVAITDMRLMDAHGALYVLDALAPGAASSASPTTVKPPKTQLALTRATSMPIVNAVQLRKGTFIADLERSPYFQTGLSAMELLQSRHVLYGHFSEETDARQP